MVRNGFLALIAAVLFFGLARPTASAGDDDKESRIRTQLAIQTALQQGRDNLQRGNYQAAVYCLEREIARIDGNREYINALREAYRGYVHELRDAHKEAEAKKYLERLKILDPGYQIEQNAGRAVALPTVAELASRPTDAEHKSEQRKYTARPQMPDEPDPFADSNRAPPPSIREQLERAKQEFKGKNYLAAKRLFEEANRVDAGAMAAYRDLWAFCKLFAVVDAVNQSTRTPPAELEKEVLSALALASSPQLQRQGKDLLRALKVQHVPAQGQNWPEAQSENFRVIHNQSRELAEQVARVAETTRTAVIRKWFEEEPTAWSAKCRIVLYADAKKYASDRRVPADSPGHTTLRPDGARGLDRRIDLHCDVAHLLTAVLPHETTHAVLAGRFGARYLPRWVDEGVAVLSEPRSQIERHLRNLPQYRSKGELFAVGQLMNMPEYPEARRVGVFYAQSISLVDFLASQKGGPRLFMRFVGDGMESGYEAALRRHYGFRNFSELENRWMQFAFDKSTDTAALYVPRR